LIVATCQKTSRGFAWSLDSGRVGAVAGFSRPWRAQNQQIGLHRASQK